MFCNFTAFIFSPARESKVDQALNNLPGVPNLPRQALWRAAIMHFIKCCDHRKSRHQV
jgi:hypothetical protein